MIKIKLTPKGGYVLGDGDCPFDPDQFLIAFGNKIQQAQLQGLTEIGFSDEEVAQITAQAQEDFRQEVMDAPVVMLPEPAQRAAKVALLRQHLQLPVIETQQIGVGV